MERRAWLGASSGREKKKKRGGKKVTSSVELFQSATTFFIILHWKNYGLSEAEAAVIMSPPVCLSGSVCVYISSTTLFLSILMDSTNVNAITRHG